MQNGYQTCMSMNIKGKSWIDNSCSKFYLCLSANRQFTCNQCSVTNDKCNLGNICAIPTPPSPSPFSMYTLKQYNALSNCSSNDHPSYSFDFSVSNTYKCNKMQSVYSKIYNYKTLSGDKIYF